MTSCFCRDVRFFDRIFLSTFPRTFCGAARFWFDTLPRDSYFSWISFLGIFYRAFPTLDMRHIITFTQHDGESFHRVWARYHGILIGCPEHAFDSVHCVRFFFEGLHPTMQDFVGDANGGGLFDERVLAGADAQYGYLVDLAEQGHDSDRLRIFLSSSL